MSFMNQHMETGINGIRGSVIINDIDAVLKDTTWDNFKERHVSNQEYGWTRFNDLTIVAYYFKHRFNMNAAGYDIGYIGSARNPVSNGVAYRLKRVNMKSFIDIARGLLKAGLMSKDDLCHILTEPVYSAKLKPGKQPWSSALYKWFCKRIVSDALKKWGSRKVTADKLGVKMEIIVHWLELDITDPMIKKTQRG